MMYTRFIVCLAIGLFGLSLLMKTLLDGIFLDWDMMGDMRAYFSHMGQKNRYMQIYDYEAETARLRTRLVAVKKTEVLPELPIALAPPKPAPRKTFPGIWARPLAPGAQGVAPRP